MSARDGRFSLNIVRCLLADSTLPPFLWGELMHTVVYLSNRTPHAALQNGTPYKALHGKDAYLGRLRAIWSRAFVDEETTDLDLGLRSAGSSPDDDAPEPNGARLRATVLSCLGESKPRSRVKVISCGLVT